jgi:hypothetical protein
LSHIFSSRFENWAHTGGSEGDEPGSLSGIHWCQGSGTTSVEMTLDWLRDAYIDVVREIERERERERKKERRSERER